MTYGSVGIIQWPTSPILVNHNLHHESCIDHFVASSNVHGNIRQHDVNDTPLNPATHCPVMLVFDTSYRYPYEEPEHVADERPVKVAWHKVNDETIDRYKRRIDELIPNMIMSSDTLFCNNVLCECWNHRSDIDDVCKQLRRFALAFIHSHSGATGVFRNAFMRKVAEATSCLPKTLQTT